MEIAPLEVVIFHSALAVRENGEVVIALFNGDPVKCVAMLKGSLEATQALIAALGSALKSDET